MRQPLWMKIARMPESSASLAPNAGSPQIGYDWDMRIRHLPLFAAAAAVAGALALTCAVGVRAQQGVWAIDTNACTPDGKKCIKGLVKEGPFGSREDCERHAQLLLRQYYAAHLKVAYMRCVPL